jgi:hypothetical protein
MTACYPNQLADQRKKNQLKLQVKQPLPLKRILIGAGITVLGILFLSRSQEMLGLICLLAGLMIGVRGSSGPVIVFIFVAIQFSLVILFMFWAQTHGKGWTFDEWASEHWMYMAVYGGMLALAIASQYLIQESSWDALHTDFSDVPDWTPKFQEYPMMEGMLCVDEEMFDISSITTELGVILSRNGGESLFFPWEKVKEIRVLDQANYRATLDIHRRTTIPLRLEIPWSEDFKKWIPSDIQTFGV